MILEFDKDDFKGIDYKFNEDMLIEEFQEYIDSTYSGHYSKDNFQATEFKGEYKLAPLDSKLYALKSKEEEIIVKEEPEKRYGLFGEFKQGA